MKKLALISLLIASTALAGNKDKADSLFKQGKKLAAEKKYGEACPAFEQSMKLDPAIGTQLNIGSLGTQGRFVVPSLTPGNAAQNAFVQPFVNQYGYVCPPNPTTFGLTCTAGALAGGGTVGYGQFARGREMRRSPCSAKRMRPRASSARPLEPGSRP